MVVEVNVTLIRFLLLYFVAFFTLNLLLFIYKQLFLSLLFAVFLVLFCADKKYQKALRMEAFLTPNEVDDFWEIKYIKEKIIFQIATTVKGKIDFNLKK